MLWVVLGCFGSRGEKFVRLWILWKVLEALGMLPEALGSIDVNMVCPLPGSWINHFPFRIACM